MKRLTKLALAGGLAIVLSAAAHAGQITVEAGKASAIKLNTNADSVIIGNPNIADVAVHDDTLLFVTGKSFGTTNLMIFDKQGNTLVSSDVVVTANSDTWVSVKRGGDNFTYDCSPSCRPTLATGDEQEHYANVGEQLLLQKELNSPDD